LGEVAMAVRIIDAKQGLDHALSEVAAAIFDVCGKQGIDGDLVIGLCGGRSVVGLLSALEKEAVRQPAELLRRVHFYMVDERLVPLADERSNFGGLKRQLFDSLIARKFIDESQLHPFVPDPSLPDWGCSTYAESLKQRGGKFTVAVLGVGEDGHIAGLFPAHPLLNETGALFASFTDSPKPPAGRMSATPPLLTSADLAIVLVLGDAKRAAWRSFNDPSEGVESCPAKLATRARECLVLTDLD
jgi:6-phosphogluconolactonase